MVRGTRRAPIVGVAYYRRNNLHGRYGPKANRTKELLMFRWFWRLLYESTPAEFRSCVGRAESVERLRAATKRSVFSAIGETAAVGKVSETVVRLQRIVPMVGNSFKPFFTGRFEIRDGVTVLIGRFSLLTIVKVFM